MPETLIVIPHYGSDQLLAELFKSMGYALPASGIGGPLTLIRQPSYSFLIVNNNISNIGFTAACNQGLRRALNARPAFESVWLLNNDTAFESRAQFEQSLAVLQFLSKTRDWAIVAQQVLHFEQPDFIIFGGAWECYPAGRHKSGLRSRGDCALPTEENWLSFCSVLVRTDLISCIGPMDEAFNNYYSDSDYSLAARQAGFRIGYAGKDSFLYHRVGQSSNPGQAQRQVLHNDYMAFWRKWIGGPRHAEYLRLMGAGSAPAGTSIPRTYFRAGDLALAALKYPELRLWLESLPGDQLLAFTDILDHFQHQQPAAPFAQLCHITREMLEPS